MFIVQRRVNAVETLFASFPMFMFVDPTLGAPLLEPLLRFQSSSSYTSSFAAADIGQSIISLLSYPSNCVAGSGYPIAKAASQGTAQLGVEG